jgi:hypothetical protein
MTTTIELLSLLSAKTSQQGVFSLFGFVFRRGSSKSKVIIERCGRGEIVIECLPLGEGGELSKLENLEE